MEREKKKKTARGEKGAHELNHLDYHGTLYTFVCNQSIAMTDHSEYCHSLWVLHKT